MPKTPNVMGFSGSVNGTTKNPGFLDFGFCQCKWAYGCIVGVTLSLSPGQSGQSGGMTSILRLTLGKDMEEVGEGGGGGGRGGGGLGTGADNHLWSSPHYPLYCPEG